MPKAAQPMARKISTLGVLVKWGVEWGVLGVEG